MRKSIVLSSILMFICSLCFGQAIRQFSTFEVVSLFDKTQADVYKYLANKNYSYEGKEVGFDKFVARTGSGVYRADLFFRNGKLSSISTNESFQIARMIPLDLSSNFFDLTSSSNNESEIIPYEGCIYGLKNKKLGLIATYIISRQNPYIVVVNYGKDPNAHITGSLSLKLKTLKDALSKESEKQEKADEYAKLKEKVEGHEQFRDYETTNKPSLLLNDTTGLKDFFLKCIYSPNSSSYSVRIDFDETGKAMKCNFNKSVSYGYGQQTNDVNYTSSVYSEAEILKYINTFFKLSSPGLVHFNGKDISVPVTYNIPIGLRSRVNVTKQNVSVKKNKQGFIIDMTDANNFDGGEESLIKRNSFSDNSYVQKIKDYISSTPPADLSKYRYGINYYAIKRSNRVEIVVGQDNSGILSFDFDTWKIQQSGGKNLYSLIDD
jgi:hypothetical protein